MNGLKLLDVVFETLAELEMAWIIFEVATAVSGCQAPKEFPLVKDENAVDPHGIYTVLFILVCISAYISPSSFCLFWQVLYDPGDTSSLALYTAEFPEPGVRYDVDLQEHKSIKKRIREGWIDELTCQPTLLNNFFSLDYWWLTTRRFTFTG